MKLLFFSLFIALFCSTGAQTEFYYLYSEGEYEEVPVMGKQREIRELNNIKAQSATTVQYKKGKPCEKTAETVVSGFNEKGQLILKEKFDYQNKLVEKTTYVVNDSGWVLDKKVVDKKGKVDLQIKKDYSPTGQISSFEHHKNGKLKSKYTCKFDGRYLLDKTIYKKDGQSIQKQFVYSYQSDWQLKTTKLYNGKGSIKHLWNHDCLPEGEMLSARKDTSTVCRVKEELGDGRYVTYIKNVDEKGHLTTTTTWYTQEYMADSSMTQVGGKHPYTTVSKIMGEGKTFVHFLINEKGDTTYMYSNLRSENENILDFRTWSYSKKAKGLLLRGYGHSEENDKGLLIKKQRFLGDKQQSETTITYMYF